LKAARAEFFLFSKSGADDHARELARPKAKLSAPTRCFSRTTESTPIVDQGSSMRLDARQEHGGWNRVSVGGPTPFGDRPKVVRMRRSSATAILQSPQTNSSRACCGGERGVLRNAALPVGRLQVARERAAVAVGRLGSLVYLLPSGVRPPDVAPDPGQPFEAVH
jgi:hypothetical protein